LPETFIYPSSIEQDGQGFVILRFPTDVVANLDSVPFVGASDVFGAITVSDVTQGDHGSIRIEYNFLQGEPSQFLHWGRGANAIGVTPAGVRVGSFVIPGVV
jgi:hypothetical protein